jgi:hypothetical protein
VPFSLEERPTDQREEKDDQKHAQADPFLSGETHLAMARILRLGLKN